MVFIDSLRFSVPKSRTKLCLLFRLCFLLFMNGEHCFLSAFSNFLMTKLCCLNTNVNISKCFRGFHAPSIVIYNRKRLSATRRGWCTLQGHLSRHSTTVRVVIVRTFSRNEIVRVVIVRCCLTKGRSAVQGRQLTTILIIHRYKSYQVSISCF